METHANSQIVRAVQVILLLVLLCCLAYASRESIKLRWTKLYAYLQSKSSAFKFLTDVFALYRSHFWLIIRVVAPAVVFEYGAFWYARRYTRENWRQYRQLGSPPPSPEVLHRAMYKGLVANTAYCISTWVLYCLVFALVCIAVRGINARAIPSIRESFGTVRAKLGRFLPLSLVLFGLLSLNVAVGIFVLTFPFAFRNTTAFRLVYTQPFLLIIIPALGLPLARFGLAIPGVILDDLSVRNALRRSKEMTSGRWRILLLLLIIFSVGEKLASMQPFLLASHALGYNSPEWLSLPLLVAAAMPVGVAVSTLTQPTLLIGFALLYEQSSKGPLPQEGSSL